MGMFESLQERQAASKKKLEALRKKLLSDKAAGVPGTEAKLRFCEDALQDCAAALPPELKGLFGMFDSMPKAGG